MYQGVPDSSEKLGFAGSHSGVDDFDLRVGFRGLWDSERLVVLWIGKMVDEEYPYGVGIVFRGVYVDAVREEWSSEALQLEALGGKGLGS